MIKRIHLRVIGTATIAGLALFAACGKSTGVSGPTTAPPGPDTVAASLKVLVSQVSSDPAVPAGEAWLVTDPRDSNKVLVTWLGTRDSSRPDPEGAGYCGVARSLDGGRTWSATTKPLDPSDPPICGDPVGAVGPDGTVYLGAVQLISPAWMAGIASYDFGSTWEPRTEIFGINQMVAAAAANPGHRTPAIDAGRAFMAADPITGEVSVHSQEDGGVEGRWLTVSSDRGKTWSVPRPLDPDIQSATAGPHSAAGGIIAVLYVVDPASPNYITSPSPAVVCAEKCLVFATTRDKGETWTRQVMPVTFTAPPAIGFPPYLVAADPSRLGRFTVLVMTNSATAMEFWVTNDTGASWTKTTVLKLADGDTVTKPWISYSPTGTLGAFWRARHADGSVVPSAMVSRDGGGTFSKVVPMVDTPIAASGSLPGDDCACNLQLDQTTLSATWTDSSTGQRQVYFGRFDYTGLR